MFLNEGHATLSPTTMLFKKESTCFEAAFCSPQVVEEIRKQQQNAQSTSYLCCFIQYLSLKRLNLCACRTQFQWNSFHFIRIDDTFSYLSDC